MEIAEDSPRLPKLPFIVADIVLIGTAGLLGSLSGAPLSNALLVAIFGCIALGAVLLALPFVLDYTRQQEALLAERQAMMEVMTRDNATAAEQLSIAASGIHDMAERVQESLRQLEDQAKSSGPNSGQSTAPIVTAANEQLTDELSALGKTVHDLRKMLVDLQKRQASNEDSLRSLGESLTALPIALEQILEAHLNSLPTPALAAEETTAESHTLETEPSPAPVEIPAEPPAKEPPAISESEPVAEVAAPSPPEVLEPEEVPVESEIGPDIPPEESVAEPLSEPLPDTSDAPLEPPDSTDPTPAGAPLDPLDHEPGLPANMAPTEQTPRPPRVRSRVADQDQHNFLALVDTPLPPVVRPDPQGHTQVFATAYIGIGNRLYIRGDGPGLSWTKGLPMEFVSIGKWRWETAKPCEPFTAKLYKNDEVECGALGSIAVTPAHRVEVSASF